MRCWMDIQVDGSLVGRMVFELFPNTCPKLCRNFVGLCEQGYKGSSPHRIIKDFMVQAGDYTVGDGTGGESIYDGREFEDEDLVRTHDEPYLLSSANRGPNTNGSQFFITSKPLPHLDGKHCVFGRMIAGKDVFHMIEDSPVDKNDAPLCKIVIIDCGEMVKLPTNAEITEVDENIIKKLKKKSKKRSKKREEDEEAADAGSFKNETINPLVAGVMLPDNWEEPRQWLDRSCSGKHHEFRARTSATDVNGRVVKGRGNVKFDSYKSGRGRDTTTKRRRSRSNSLDRRLGPRSPVRTEEKYK